MTRNALLLPDQRRDGEVNGALRVHLHDLTVEAHVLEQQLHHRSDVSAILGGHRGLIDAFKIRIAGSGRITHACAAALQPAPVCWQQRWSQEVELSSPRPPTHPCE